MPLNSESYNANKAFRTQTVSKSLPNDNYILYHI